MQRPPRIVVQEHMSAAFFLPEASLREWRGLSLDMINRYFYKGRHDWPFLASY